MPLFLRGLLYFVEVTLIAAWCELRRDIAISVRTASSS
jgi:hypothetical protein